MANTTDIIISCFGEVDDEIVLAVAEEAGLNLPKITNSEECGGHKTVGFESYAASYRCIGKQRIDFLIKTFKGAGWQFPELTVMIIDDDNDLFSGVVTVT